MYYTSVTKNLTAHFAKSIKTWNVWYIYMHQLEGTDMLKRAKLHITAVYSTKTASEARQLDNFDRQRSCLRFVPIFCLFQWGHHNRVSKQDNSDPSRESVFLCNVKHWHKIMWQVIKYCDLLRFWMQRRRVDSWQFLEWRNRVSVQACCFFLLFHKGNECGLNCIGTVCVL